MKKITGVLVAIIAGTMFQAQAQTVMSSETQALLDQLRSLPPTSQTVKQTIAQNFNESEQSILSNYFANEAANRPPLASRGLADDVYAFDIQSYDLGTFPLAGPYAIRALSSPENLFLADDFDADGNWYALGGFNGELQLLSVSPVDGSFTGIGPLTIPSGVPSGLSYNPVNQTWYMTNNRQTNNIRRSELYRVNINTGAITLINTNTGMDTSIWLEIDNNGIAYSLDITNDSLYKVDLQTGVATLIGPFGVNTQYTQEAFIDPETNKLYAAAYTNDFKSGMYSVDVTTGAGTKLYDTSPAELTMASMKTKPQLAVNKDKLSAISVFPNPVNDVLNIKTPSNIDVKNITINDLSGKKYDASLLNGQVNLGTLVKGVYIVSIETSAGTITKKIVKE